MALEIYRNVLIDNVSLETISIILSGDDSLPKDELDCFQFHSIADLSVQLLEVPLLDILFSAAPPPPPKSKTTKTATKPTTKSTTTKATETKSKSKISKKPGLQNQEPLKRKNQQKKKLYLVVMIMAIS